MRTRKTITLKEWCDQNIITDFATIQDEDFLQTMKQKFPLRKIQEQDLFFTDEIEDDRINSTVKFADYDWMTYTYDTRFPTLSHGTLAIRFKCAGLTKSTMYVHQYLPKELTKEKENYIIYHQYEFPTNIFESYMKKDILSRIDNMEHSTLAYYCGDLLMEWYNAIIQNYQPIKTKQIEDECFEWESVRRLPKHTTPQTIIM